MNDPYCDMLLYLGALYCVGNLFWIKVAQYIVWRVWPIYPGILYRTTCKCLSQRAMLAHCVVDRVDRGDRGDSVDCGDRGDSVDCSDCVLSLTVVTVLCC
jgi:hypothetical protein